MTTFAEAESMLCAAVSLGHRDAGIALTGPEGRPTTDDLAEAILRRLMAVGWSVTYTGKSTNPSADNFAGYYFGCPHTDDVSYDGKWCAICDPRTGGDRMQGK